MRECASGDLAEMIGQLHALEMATRATLCEVVAAFDQRRAWQDDGARSMAARLTMQLGMGYGSAASSPGWRPSSPSCPRSRRSWGGAS